ncbi:MAG: hypothetical protein WAV00_14875 [Nocardioides sp.]
MEPDLAMVASLSGGDDHVRAEEVLTRHGWTRCGLGDWAVVLRSPSATLAARIAPFDPVAPYTAQLFREAAPTRQVPVLHGYVELDGGAVCTVMELLGPVEEERAAAFFRGLEARDPELVDLAVVIDRVLARARAELPWCGPLDPNPSNVMARCDGSLVLTDPFYADGPHLYGSLTTDASLVARAIPAHARRHMFDLPLTWTGPWDPAERARMEAALAAADADLAR